MEISALTLKLIILLIPGVLATKIYKRLTTYVEQSDFMFIIASIIHGIFSYLILQLINYNQEIETFKKISDTNTIPYFEILWASIIGVALGFLTSLIHNRKLINKVAEKLKISRKYGDDSLYYYFLGSPDINWVYIRELRTP